MNAIEAATNMVVAMINNKFISTPDEIADAYKKIHAAVKDPYDVNEN